MRTYSLSVKSWNELLSTTTIEPQGSKTGKTRKTSGLGNRIMCA